MGRKWGRARLSYWRNENAGRKRGWHLYNWAIVPFARGIRLAQLALVFVFAVHLLCVNVASAGPLVCVWLEWCEGRGNALAGEAGRYLARWALWLLLPGGLLGVVIGWLLWDAQYQAVLGQLSSKVFFGVWEVFFSFALMAVQLFWWQKQPQCRPWQRGLRMVLLLLASSNLLYHFPILFAVIEQLATSTADADAAEKISGSEFRTFLAQPAILARALHFVLAAIATCGIVLLGYALRMMRHKRDAADIQRVAAWGGQIALVPTLLQIPVGLWLTFTLPPTAQHAATGGDFAATTLFLLSIMGAFALMQTLAAIAIGDVERGRLIRAIVLLVVVVVLMGGVLQRLRAMAHARRASANANANVSQQFDPVDPVRALTVSS